MTGARLLAGAGGLDRSVASATVLDAPDGAAWLQANELAFTSTYPLIALSDSLDGFVQLLAERGVSGLGVKLTRYMTSIPGPVIEIADRLDFPIVSLPEQVSWIELINPIITNVINRQADRLRRSKSIHDGFTESLIARSRLEDLAALLEGMVGNTVVIDCPGEGISAWSAPPSEAERARILNRLRGEGDAERVDADHGVHRTGDGAGAIVHVPLASEADDMDCLLHAQKAASIKVLQMQAELQIRRSRESNFVISLLDRQASAPVREKIIQSGINSGYSLLPPHVLVACELSGIADRRISAVVKRMHAFLAGEERVVLGFPERNVAAIVFSGNIRDDVLDRIVGALFDSLRLIFPALRLRAGVSRRLPSLTDLPEGYVQAEQVLRYRTGNEEPSRILRLEEIALLRLFTSDAVRPEAQRFVSDLLEPLLTHDCRNNSNLLSTLRIFLQANGNHRLAAQGLNLHHNSVRYRIAKIRKLTGHDVMARNLRLQYELALTLLPIIGESK